MTDFPRGCFVTGFGQSETGRHLDRPSSDLTIDAALSAVADAGLEANDIDGVASYPGGSPYLFDVQEALGLDVDWYAAGAEGAAQIGPLVEACMAVATGQARHVLVYRTVAMLGGDLASIPNEGLAGATSWQRPYGALSAANWFALRATRFLHERGLDRHDLAQIALLSRANAAGNPMAVYRAPLTLDEYLDARMVSTPLCLYDCDAPCSGSVAFVVSAAPIRGHPERALRFEAIAGPSHGRRALDQYDRMTLWDAAAQLWERTRLRPTDVDVAQLYDGFSSITLEWLEALGFCAERRVADLLREPEQIALDGRIPLNTGGGMLSAGRIHGFLQLLEACIQLRGEGGARQVRPQPEVAVVGVGGGPVAGCLLLTRTD
jgi:acetyl-CoA acetyltransferase